MRSSLESAQRGVSTKRYTLGLLLAVALLIGLRLPLIRCGAFGADVPNFNDESNYVFLASSLLHGDNYADTAWPWTRAPATSLVLLVIGLLRGLPPELVVCDFQVLQVAIWAGLLLLTAWIAATLFDRRTALVAAFLVALLPEVMLLSVLIYSETLHCAGLLVSVAALFTYSRRPRLHWLVIAGIAAGISALARSSMLPLLPVLALWVLLEGWTKDEGRRTKEGLSAGSRSFVLRPSSFVLPSVLRPSSFVKHLLPPALFVACCVLTIAPWTIRNYRAYGGLIVIDTTSAVTLWASNSELDRGTTSAMIWSSSRNPVERQRYAMRQAWATITGAPGRFWEKVASESVGAWAFRDYDVTRGVWADVLQQPRTGELLAQLQGLLSIVIPLSLLGLAFAPSFAVGSSSYRLAMVGLALCFTATMAVAHFEGRYRTPFILLLLPYAAWCIAHPRALLARLRQPVGWLAIAITVVYLVAYTSALWPNQWHGAQALVLHGRGLLRATWGDWSGALVDQQAAVALQPALMEARVAAAQDAVQSNNLTVGEQILRDALAYADRNRDDAPVAVVTLQKLLLQQGRAEEASALDGDLSVLGRRRAEPLAWGQEAAPGPALHMGINDQGLVQGFYTRQNDDGTFRWSRSEARALLAGQGDNVCLRLNAARPSHVSAPTIRLSARLASGGSTTQLGQVTPPRQGWAWVCVPAPTRSNNATFELGLSATSYHPFEYVGGNDTRDLGVAVEQIELRSGPLSVDPATGLLLDHLTAQAITKAAPSNIQPQLTMFGLSGTLDGHAGATLPLTLWWRGTTPPPSGTFTFLHLLDADGKTVSAYNAPLAAGQLPTPWIANEPLADQTSLSLPADLKPGSYRLEGGAFDPATGSVLSQSELGTLAVKAK